MGTQSPDGRSEREVVDLGVVEAAGAVAVGRRRGAGRGRSRRERPLALLALVEPDDGVGRDVERHALSAVLRLVFAGLEAAVDEDPTALPELLRGALRAIAPDAHAKPVGGLVPLARLLVPRRLVDGDA